MTDENNEVKDYKWAVRHHKLNDTQKEDLCRRGHCRYAIPCVDKPRFIPWGCACKDGLPAYPPVPACPMYEYDEPNTATETGVKRNARVKTTKDTHKGNNRLKQGRR